jgi:hypothetical protein
MVCQLGESEAKELADLIATIDPVMRIISARSEAAWRPGPNRPDVQRDVFSTLHFLRNALSPKGRLAINVVG